MALTDHIQARPAAQHGGLPCSVGALLGKLEGDEHAALLTMLGTSEQRGWSQAQIYDALNAEGYTVAMRSINRHRAGRCRCVRDAS